MTQNELRKIFEQADAEMKASLSKEKLSAIMRENSEDDEPIASATFAAYYLSQQFLFKVLVKALCKD